MTNVILAAGDSWTFGSEIRDPMLSENIKDWDHRNNEYRLPRTWPNILASKINASAINIAYPGSSNDRIIRTTKDWLIKNYISKEIKTTNLLVIIGLTSPERKDFYYKDKETDAWVTIWPMWEPNYQQTNLKKFHDLYVKHMWNPEEYVHRYVNQIFDLQNFFKIYGINHLFFQAFYQHQNLSIPDWYDYKYVNSWNTMAESNQMIWKLIDDVRFMNKNEKFHSFHSYITGIDKKIGTKHALINQHPSEIGHAWWAEYILEYCTSRNMI